MVGQSKFRLPDELVDQPITNSNHGHSSIPTVSQTNSSFSSCPAPATSFVGTSGSPLNGDRNWTQQNAPLFDQPRQRSMLTPSELNHIHITRQKFAMPSLSVDQLVSEQNQQIVGPDFERHQTVPVTVRGGKNDGDQFQIGSFEEANLSQQILQNLLEIRYIHPTAVQSRVIPLIMRTNEDLVCLSSTGTGKTGAFLIPIINCCVQRFIDRVATKRRSPKAIIIAHTKELVQQIHKMAQIVARGTGVGIVFMMGSVHYRLIEDQITRNGCDVIVTTPGRLFEYVMKTWIDLDCLQFLVVDEMDKFFSDREFVKVFTELKQAKDRCETHLNGPCRTLMFSATLDSPETIEQFIRPNFYHVEAGGVNQIVAHVRMHVISTSMRNSQKSKDLTKILTRDNGTVERCTKTVVFVNECRRCDRLAIMLAYRGFRAISINGNRTLEQRSIALAKFNAGEFDILVGTDIIARGMNILNLTRVVVYEMPPIHRYEQFVHRVGRVGRMGNAGDAFVFFDPIDIQDVQMSEFLRDQLVLAKQNVPKFLSDLVDGQHRWETKVQEHVEQEAQQSNNANGNCSQWPPPSLSGQRTKRTETTARAVAEPQQELDEDQDELRPAGFTNSDWC